MIVAVATLIAGGVAADEAAAQWRQTDVGWCEDEWGGSDRDRHCMVLEASFDGTDALVVDAGRNGGVSVEGWDRSQVEVRAKVSANARSEARAEEIANEIAIEMRRGRLWAEGPSTGRNEGWSVSFEVMVPRDTDLEIETYNGGISVARVDGTIRFEALNGGVHLTEVAGDVEGHTTNGGLHIELAGDRWDGDGLDVETVNGGITLTVPEDFSAELETGTVNGGIDIDFPVTVRGRIGRRLTTTLGDGGPRVRAFTTNGGVKIRRGSRTLR